MAIDPVSLAITVALNAAMMAMNAMRKIEGPRISDLSVSVADYGTPLNYLVGQRRAELSCFYAEPIQERRVRRKTKSGKYAEYTYFGTWASIIADMEIQSVDSVYFDRHLIYDRITGKNLFELNEDYDLANSMRFYLGTESQDADPRMVATVELEEGVGMCPAYLGVSYIFFEDVPLEKLGNRFPQVSGVFSADIPRRYVDYIEGPQEIAVDGTVPYLYDPDLMSPAGRWGSTSIYNDQVYVFDYQRRRVDWSADVTTGFTLPDNGNGVAEGIIPMAIDDEGSLWGETAFGSGGYLIEVPRDTLLPIVRSFWDLTSATIYEHEIDFTQTFTLPSGEIAIVWRTGRLDARQEKIFRMMIKGQSLYVGGGELFDTGAVGSVPWFPTQFFQDDLGDLWVVGVERKETPFTNTSAHFWRFTDFTYSSPYPEYQEVTGLPGIDTTGSGYTLNETHAFGYFHQGSFVGVWTGRPGYNTVWHARYLFRVPLDGTGVPSVQRDLVSYYLWAPRYFSQVSADEEYIFLRPVITDDQMLQIDPLTLEDVYLHDREEWGAKRLIVGELSDNTPMVFYNPRLVAFVGNSAQYYDYTGPNEWQAGGLRLYFLPIDRDNITLGEICQFVSGQAGLTDSMGDFSDLDQRVKGYTWTQGSPKDILAPLLELHDSEVRPHGYVQEGIKRGQPLSGADLETEWFVAKDDSPLYSVRVAGDSDLPRRIFCVYADIDSEGQNNTAVAQRNAGSVATLRELSIDVSTCSMTADEVQPYVERFLRRQYTGAVRVEDLGLTGKELALEPGDVRNLVLDGEYLRGHLIRMVIGPNRVITTAWERDGAVPVDQMAGDPAAWELDTGSSVATSLDSPGAAAAGRPAPSVYDPVDSVGFLLDIPLLSDTHDQSVPFLYLAGAPATAGDWPGVDFWQSASGADDSFASGWDGIGSLDAASAGTSPTIGTDALATVIDEGTELIVVLVSGDLESITEEAMLNTNTANLAIWGNELIQFRDAVIQSDGEYILTGLVRGARGTEQHIGTQYPGDRFVLLSTGVKRHDMGASKIGVTDYYKAGTLGLSVANVTAEDLTFAAVANRPLSVVHIELARDPSGDWAVSWTRRSRYGGSLLDGRDVPLGETSELYRVRILDPYTGETVRMIESTSATVTYTVAQQTVDWGGLASDLEVEIAQISPTLDLEGFPAIASA